MSTKIGHFEILSELAKSPTGIVYKANDPESGQIVALKAVDLSAFGEGAEALAQALNQEAESTNSLTCPNLTPVFGAGEMDGKFCAAMEYVQGNSIATMLARKEGFSIWDLLDIGRQVCAGLDYAHQNKVYHYSLEPGKIMCGWDGTVKILSYGVSSGGRFSHHIAGTVPSFLHYMSPEQIRGEEIDGRSNLFSLGAMFYEMVTDRKAFDRPDSESLRQSIVESTPVPPMHVNAKLHPLLSDLIMKALEKDPASRYQRGRELLDDLEKCKESKPQAAKKAPAAPPKNAVVSDQARAAAQSKLGGSSAPSAPRATATAAPPAAPKVPAGATAAKLSTPVAAVSPRSTAAAPTKPEAAARPKASAAAAGWGHGDASSAAASESNAPRNFISASVKATIDAVEKQSAYQSVAPAEAPEVETFAADGPKVTFDPMMAEDGPASGGGGSSFSEISELPPLKEVYIAPPTPPADPAPIPSITSTSTMFQGVSEVEEKPRVQPREVAQKAIKEIKGVPPQLLMYSIGGAVALILLIAAIMFFRIHSDDDSGSSRTAPPAESTAAPVQPAQVAPAPTAVASQPSNEPEPEPEQPSARNAARAKAPKKKAAPVAVIVPGQLALDSTPQGAQVQIDGRGDPSWVTPLSMSNLEPGAHTIVVSKAGYSTDSRSIDVTSGGKATLVVHLAQLMATLAVTSNPSGANIYVDGKDMGKLTPAQVSVDKGSHTVLVRKTGYIDETTTAQFSLGQTVSISPALRPLGNVDSIKTVGKMKKLFGGNGGQPGQGTVSIRTNPKGAQVSVNQHMLDKNSPVDVMLDPGNYVLDITLSGYAPLHKVITVDKSGKVVVDENLQHE